MGMGLLALMPIFAGNTSLYSSCMFYLSHVFVWSYKVISKFLGQRWPSSLQALKAAAENVICK